VLGDDVWLTIKSRRTSIVANTKELMQIAFRNNLRGIYPRNIINGCGGEIPPVEGFEITSAGYTHGTTLF